MTQTPPAHVPLQHGGVHAAPSGEQPASTIATWHTPALQLPEQHSENPKHAEPTLLQPPTSIETSDAPPSITRLASPASFAGPLPSPSELPPQALVNNPA